MQNDTCTATWYNVISFLHRVFASFFPFYYLFFPFFFFLLCSFKPSFPYSHVTFFLQLLLALLLSAQFLSFVFLQFQLLPISFILSSLSLRFFPSIFFFWMFPRLCEGYTMCKDVTSKNWRANKIKVHCTVPIAFTKTGLHDKGRLSTVQERVSGVIWKLLE